MSDQTVHLAALVDRVEKLERQNRRWKHLGLLFLLIAGSGFLLAQVPRKALSAAPTQAVQAATYDTLVVHRLELRDKAGKLRGVWAVEADKASLDLYDTAGKRRAGLSVTADGPGLWLYDPAGKIRADLGVEADGPGLGMFDAAGELCAALSVDAERSGLALHDAAGKSRAGLAVDNYGPSLRLEDAQQFQAIVGVTETEVSETGESHKTSAAAVTLFGKDGKVIWRAP